MYGPHIIPSVGPVELSWVSNPPPGETSKGVSIDEPTVMNVDLPTKDGGNEMDYDVAEEDDSWGMQ